jgi:hypothetical protein
MPAQLAQRVVGDPHPISFSQAKATARQAHATECERYGVPQQLAFGEGHSKSENEKGTKAIGHHTNKTRLLAYLDTV